MQPQPYFSKTEARPPRLRGWERILVEPWPATVRVLIGLAVVPATEASLGSPVTPALFAGGLAAAMLAMRLGPAVLRRLLPFSPDLRAAWAHQRHLSKQYDSYQWAKLLWLGTGLVAHASYAGYVRTPAGMLSLAILGAGVAGFIAWRRHS